MRRIYPHNRVAVFVRAMTYFYFGAALIAIATLMHGIAVAAPSNQDEFENFERFNPNATNMMNALDDFGFTTVPEPTSTEIFGACLLPLLPPVRQRKRRK